MFLLTVQSQNFVQLGVKLNQNFRKGGISRVILKMSCVNSVSKKNKIQILLVFLCHLNDFKGTLFFFYKNVVFPVQVEYSCFSADFRLKIFLYYS